MFVRAYKTIKRAVCATLFSKKIRVSDIDQGSIGDCYYVSSLATSADREPDIISRAISEYKAGVYKAQFYDVFNYDNTEFKPNPWQKVEIQIDDKLEYENGEPKYSYSKEDKNEMWFPLLEKAYAAWKGGYPAIGNGGYPDVALSELTGRKSYCISTGIKYFKSDAIRKNTILGIFEKADRNNWKVVCCTGGSGEIQDASNPDVYSGHAYSYHGYNHETHMIHLRNPWGEGSNPEGYFDISVPDFLKYYDTICYIP